MNYIVYSTPNCHACQLLKEWLSQKDIPYSVVDISKNIVARKIMVDKSGQMSVPVSLIQKDGKEFVVAGFYPDKIRGIIEST